MKKTLLMTAALFFVATCFTQAAPITFFGEDLNGVNVNSQVAHDNFMASLVGVGTEDFEGIAANTAAPLALDFGLAGTATLGGGGFVNASSNYAGRFAVSGAQYWETNEDFTIDFSAPISAFGFYGTDIGDFAGQVVLTYANGSMSEVLNIGNSVGAPNGSLLYFGFFDDELANAFTSISFANTNSSDYFGFDDMTIGTYEQVIIDPVPEPSTWILMGTGLAGLAWYRRRKSA